MNYIRKADAADASRIAEILIFSKRANYRHIFNDDAVSFGEMQVLPLAQEYIDDEEKLRGVWVYDDGFVKGMIHIEGAEIAELYVEPFFAGNGIGAELTEFAIKNFDVRKLLVLEKNARAIKFYEAHGFSLTGKRVPEEGTAEFTAEMVRISD